MQLLNFIFPYKSIPSELHVSAIPIRLVVLLLLFCYGCKDENPIPPVIHFTATGTDMLPDTAIELGQTLSVQIQVEAGNANITNLLVIAEYNNQRITVLDSGLNSGSFVFTQPVVKSSATTDRWTIIVMDKNRSKDSLSFIVNLKPTINFGAIRSLSNMDIGAQQNPDWGSFLTASGSLYGQDDAFQRQDSIDFIYYFDIYDCTFSSPAENDAPAIFAGSTGLANWLTKRETRYLNTSLTSSQFSDAQHDSLLLASWSMAGSTRKAKFLAPGQIWSFLTQDGKIGLLHINSTVHGVSGSIKVDIKMQE